jgi:hypothetical protein
MLKIRDRFILALAVGLLANPAAEPASPIAGQAHHIRDAVEERIQAVRRQTQRARPLAANHQLGCRSRPIQQHRQDQEAAYRRIVAHSVLAACLQPSAMAGFSARARLSARAGVLNPGPHHLARLASRPVRQHGPQELPRVRFRDPRHLLRSAFRDDETAAIATFRPQVDQPIG